MRPNRAKTIAIALALTMLTFGFATVAAQTSKTQKKSVTPNEQVTYVNTDASLVACSPNQATVDTPDGVEVYSPFNGNLFLKQPLPNVQQSVPLTEPKYGNNVCLGGAIFDGFDNVPGNHDWIKVWAQEDIEAQLHNTDCTADINDEGEKDEHAVVNKKTLCPSGSFQIRSDYIYDNSANKPDPNCEPGTWTQVCENLLAPSDTKTWTRITHETVLCNDAAIEIEHDKLEPPHASASDRTIKSKDSSNYLGSDHDGLVFLSGALIALDCFGAANQPIPPQSVEDLYNNVIMPTVNSVTCTPPPSQPSLVCLVDPFMDTQCPSREGDTTWKIATFGTLNWVGQDTKPDNHFCQEDVNHGDFVELEGFQTASVENVPVQFQD